MSYTLGEISLPRVMATGFESTYSTAPLTLYSSLRSHISLIAIISLEASGSVSFSAHHSFATVNASGMFESDRVSKRVSV